MPPRQAVFQQDHVAGNEGPGLPRVEVDLQRGEGNHQARVGGVVVVGAARERLAAAAPVLEGAGLGPAEQMPDGHGREGDRNRRGSGDAALPVGKDDRLRAGRSMGRAFAAASLVLLREGVVEVGELVVWIGVNARGDFESLREGILVVVVDVSHEGNLSRRSRSRCRSTSSASGVVAVAVAAVIIAAVILGCIIGRNRVESEGLRSRGNEDGREEQKPNKAVLFSHSDMISRDSTVDKLLGRLFLYRVPFRVIERSTL
mmetsp:Transcript_23946/g.56569  ORF Transcript_23946/g.56569 Transcript_23946/m.56569 type:complete len:259 (+) Transcript_23946:1021-1797(+)